MSEIPPAAPAAPAYAAASGAPVPGKTLGIVALILAFFFQLVALILGIVALSQSRKAGASNLPAVFAIIVSIIGGIIWILVIVGIVTLFAQCGELGSGVHNVNGVTYTCG